MPRHPGGSQGELPPIIQKPGLVQNLLDQLGMVGPYRWELIQSVQPVVIVAEQAPAKEGGREAVGSYAVTAAAQTAMIVLENPLDSGVRLEVDWITAIVDAAVPAFLVSRHVVGAGAAATTAVWRDDGRVGGPAGVIRQANTNTGTDQLAFLEANPDNGTVGGDFVKFIVQPNSAIVTRITANFTGTFWCTYYWREFSI